MHRFLWRIGYSFFMFIHYGISFGNSWEFGAEWYDTMRKDDESMKESVNESFRLLK